jgi:MFS family permease
MPVGGGDGSYVAWLVIRVMIGMVMSGGGPTTNSLSTDLLQSNEKSQYFGYSSIVWQITQIGAMVFSAVMFSIESLWRVYFWIAGAMFLCQAVLTALRFQEPRRASKHESFTRIMGDLDLKYEYGLTSESIKATILKPTNMLVFAEGIFTNMLFGIIDLVWLPYIQSPPRNVSPFTSSVFILVYGVPGALLGSLVFSKLSDKIGAKRLRNRVSIIAWSLLGSMGLIFLAFIVPLPDLTVAEGNTIGSMFEYPVFFVFGILLMFMRCTFSIYGVNQPPVIQEINLPEAQGRLASMNQLLEIFSYGAGPLLAGIVLEFFQNNYQLSIQVTALIALPGIAMWFLAYFWIEKDQARVKQIIENRAKDLKAKAMNSDPK